MCTTATARRRSSSDDAGSASCPCTSGPGTRAPARRRIAGRSARCGTSPCRRRARRHEYVEALMRAMDAATEGWTPDLVMISAGFDSLAGDPLGGFTLELDDVELLTRALVERAERWCGGRDGQRARGRLRSRATRCGLR
ncbi:MAG: hypothetical protein U5K74_14965 [Gemmatimonadaceae bacterium]|nr:hypothetical protein [Gemmatimonadaceae bacterium]